MDEKDLELKVLKGDPIDVGIGKIHPLTLGEIAEIGTLKYNQILSVITFKPAEDVVFEGHKLTPLEVAIIYCFQQNEFKELFLCGLNKLFKESVSLHGDGFFYLGKLEEQRFVDNAVFDQIIAIVKKQNFLKEAEEEKDFKPLNDKARELQEKLKAIKSKLKQQNSDEGLSICDLISIVSAYTPNINLLSVWDLTIFQLYNLYLRLIMKDTYETNFGVYLQGADPGNLDLKHWARKINNE